MANNSSTRVNITQLTDLALNLKTNSGTIVTAIQNYSTNLHNIEEMNYMQGVAVQAIETAYGRITNLVEEFNNFATEVAEKIQQMAQEVAEIDNNAGQQGQDIFEQDATGFDGGSSGGNTPPSGSGQTIQIPDGNGRYHTYMGWSKITDKSSAQYQFREDAGEHYDSEGFAKVDGRYVIACTDTFGEIGDYVDFELEDGTVIHGVIGDFKNQNDTGCNELGHNNGDVIVEFVVDTDSWYNCGHPNPGEGSFHSEWDQEIVSATNVGSFYD
jgi:uncharacterized protein YukE